MISVSVHIHGRASFFDALNHPAATANKKKARASRNEKRKWKSARSDPKADAHQHTSDKLYKTPGEDVGSDVGRSGSRQEGNIRGSHDVVSCGG
jgi:hypothetical protein